MNVTIQVSELLSISEKVLSNRGIPQDDIQIILHHLLEQELMGKNTHGFYRLPGISKILSKNKPLGCVAVQEISSAILRVDGRNNLGLVVVEKACDAIIDKMKKESSIIAGITNYIGTTGAMGYFSKKLAQNGIISLMFCNSEYAVAPWGGMEAILGTNPIAIGLPTKNDPIIVDFATSARTYGELMLSVKKGEKVPFGLVIDSDGHPSDDPNDANEGAQLPMAGHKGYCLGLAIEILSGLFIGAKAGKNAVPGSDGMFIMALSPSTFIPNEIFYNNIESLINEIINSSPMPSAKEKIRIPGHNSIKLLRNGQKNKFIEINKDVLSEIQNLS